MLCNHQDLGQEALCQTPVHPLRVNAQDPLVLSGTIVQDETASGKQWSFDNMGTLNASTLLTSKSDTFFVLDKNVLTPGLSIRFRVTINDLFGYVSRCLRARAINRPS